MVKLTANFQRVFRDRKAAMCLGSGRYLYQFQGEGQPGRQLFRLRMGIVLTMRCLARLYGFEGGGGPRRLSRQQSN